MSAAHETATVGRSASVGTDEAHATIDAGGVEVSVVMPCLNEHETVGICVQKALQALAHAGIAGEVIVADNGSTDGSIAIAESLGARVVSVAPPGYGNALMGGIEARPRTFRDHGRRRRQL